MLTIEQKTEINKASIELFNCYIDENVTSNQPGSQEALLQLGVLIDKDVPSYVYSLVRDKYADYSVKFNQTFHKTFGIVRDTPDYVLFIQQVIHYVTTYGFESLGVYSDNTVYIPCEQLDILKTNFRLSECANLKLIAVRGVSSKELTQLVTDLCKSNIALSDTTLKNLLVLKDYINPAVLNDLEDIKNKELRVILYKELNILPNNPIEFLRYLIFVSCSTTMLIKSKDLYRKLSTLDNVNRTKIYNLFKLYFNKYGEQYSYCKLGEVFLRYRKLFICMKWRSNTRTDEEAVIKKELNKIINKLRHSYADKYHKTVQCDFDTTEITNYLSRKVITEQDESSYYTYITNLTNRLKNLSIYKLISTYNGLAYTYQTYNSYKELNSNVQYKVYKIRNGKTYVNKISLNHVLYSNLHKLKSIMDYILNIIVTQVNTNFKNSVQYKIRIPSCVNYTCPTSEKLFIGNIPEGTMIQTNNIDDGVVFGVHWYNVGDERVDLDLHVSNLLTHIGWNGNYKNTDDGEIYFSGDITNAPLPDGASECMYIRGVKQTNYLVTLNNYNASHIDVPYKLYISKANKEDVEKQHTFDINKLLVCCDNIISRNTNNVNIGQLVVDNNCMKFIFDCNSINSNISIPNTDIIDVILKYRQAKVTSQLTFRELFSALNNFNNCDKFIVVDENYSGSVDIDLSFNKLDKMSFLNILQGRKLNFE